MLLIADSGSTKCDWVLIENKEKKPIKIKTKGLNPAILNKEKITQTLEANKVLSLYKDRVTTVYFFGAGCNTLEAVKLVEEVLSAFFKKADVPIVKEDTMAAVWATTNKPAVVCILGTGSNCCYYDGENIHLKVPAMGYLLMDEASGNYFGKEVLKSYYYNQMPTELRNSFEKEYSLNENEVINNLYQSEAPNKYLAEFTMFLFENKEHSLMDLIIREGISKFIDNNVLQFKNELKTVPLCFVGSVAFYAQDYIMSALKERGLKASRFVKCPIDNVIHNIVNKEFLKTPNYIA